MSIVGGLDLHRRQLTYDQFCLETGEIERGRIVPGDREHLRAWLARIAGEEDVEFVVEGCTRRWVGEQATGIARVEVEVNDDYGPGRHKKAFQGRFLTTVAVPGRSGTKWIVYVTAKDQLALYGDRELTVYKDIDHLQANLPHPEILAQIREALKREYIEELDI